MLTNSVGRVCQGLVRVYLIALLLALYVTALLMLKGGRNWGFGDWLINYEGGFIRRGLMGEICLLLGRATHSDPIYFVALIGVLCYSVLFSMVWRLLEGSSWRWWAAAVLVSPLTLAFPVISRTSFRKEILYYALFSGVLVWLRDWSRKVGSDWVKDRRGDWKLTTLLSVAFPVLVLSHEPLMEYFVPYMTAALLIYLKEPKRVAKILILPALLCAIEIPFVLTHFGSQEAVARVCASIGAPDVSHCSEAVRIVAQTREEALRDVAVFTKKYHYYPHYLFAVTMAMIPFVRAYRELWKQPELQRTLRIVLAAFCVAGVWSWTLFHYGIDWGRWIHMHTMSLCLLLLAVDSLRIKPPVTESAPLWRRRAVLGFLVLYAICWSAPGVKDKPVFGYLSLGYRIVHWNGSLTN